MIDKPSRRQFVGMLTLPALSGIFAQTVTAQEGNPTAVCVFAGPRADLGPSPRAGRDQVYIATDEGDIWYSFDGADWSSAGFESRLIPETLVDADTMTAGERYVRVDTSLSAITVTLSTSDAVDTNMVTLKDVAGNAGTNAVTIETEGSATIDGATSGTLDSNYQSAELRYAADTDEWEVINITGSSGGTL